ncbi:hypothetical protein ERJ75_001436600 [Trypanosoma vivax]|uniref:Checkpoint protein n=1 Tax=Trypanosoma vivax (strain Y486) TaxID=1055687 RepID=G0TRM0_TRYVY|nr:hypothetical protein TRVL_03715 [Trypanosoma vivax]KAH8607284.1 hypothetical protein ERJ75_001436600 [Trypanosoma vivax]CCC46590.1 conserved hypothetical protein [Trypanosoma vivax Y486]
MNCSFVTSFTFPSLKALALSLRYLCVLGGEVRVTVTDRKEHSEVCFAVIGDTKRNYAEVLFNRVVNGKIWTERFDGYCDVNSTYCFVVHGPLFLRVLRLFEGSETFTIKLSSDLTTIFVHGDGLERGARLSVLHDLGPHLNVEHGVGYFHSIPNTREFQHVVEFVKSSDEIACCISIDFNDMYSFIELKTSTATASVAIDNQSIQSRVEGGAAIEELASFASLASSVGLDAKLSVGVGSGGLVVFKLEWNSCVSENSEKSVAYLYSCVG